MRKLGKKQQEYEEKRLEGAQQQVGEERSREEHEAQERRSGAKQRALKEKRCEIETNKSRTDSYSCGSHCGRNTWPQ